MVEFEMRNNNNNFFFIHLYAPYWTKVVEGTIAIRHVRLSLNRLDILHAWDISSPHNNASLVALSQWDEKDKVVAAARFELGSATTKRIT